MGIQDEKNSTLREIRLREWYRGNRKSGIFSNTVQRGLRRVAKKERRSPIKAVNGGAHDEANVTDVGE